MNAFLWIAIALFPVSLILSAIAYYTQSKKMRVLALVACIAIGVTSLIGMAVLGFMTTLWWFGLPIIFAAFPMFFGSMIGAFAKYIDRKTKDGLSTGMKVLCVILILLGACGLPGLIRGLIARDSTPLIVGTVFCLVFLVPGILLLRRWTGRKPS